MAAKRGQLGSVFGWKPTKEVQGCSMEAGDGELLLNISCPENCRVAISWMPLDVNKINKSELVLMAEPGMTVANRSLAFGGINMQMESLVFLVPF